MNPIKKLMLLLSILLLASLACSTVTNLLGGNNAPPPAVNDNSSAESNQSQNNTADNDAVQPADTDNQPVDDDSQNIGDDDAAQPTGPMFENVTITAIGAAADVEIIEFNWEEDEYGDIVFIGILQNNGSVDLSFVGLAFTLRNADGIAVGTNPTYASLNLVPVGGTSPFTIVFYDAPYDPWESVEILISGDENDWFTYNTEFEVISSELVEGDYGYEIVGEVQNVGNETSDYVSLIAAVYDSAGNLITVEFTFADADVMAPGDISSFSISVWDTIGNAVPDHFTLYIEGNVVSD